MICRKLAHHLPLRALYLSHTTFLLSLLVFNLLLLLFIFTLFSFFGNAMLFFFIFLMM